MAGLVYCAYQGCLQERYPISHSSCFDVWYRGLPVPPHSLRYVEPFELADCGKDPAPPPVAPLRSMSIGVCNLVIAALNQALADSAAGCPSKGSTSRNNNKTRRTLLQTAHQN